MSEKKVTKIVWNENRIKASEALKCAEKPLTLDEINEKGGCKMVSGSVQALTACGVWEIVGETTKPTKVKGFVNRYAYVNDESITKGNDKQVAIINVLKNSHEPLTLKEISERVGFEVKSGTASTMMEHGAIKALDEQIEVTRVRAKGRLVKLYRLNVEKYNKMRKKEA